MMNEIYQRGPITCAMAVTQEFINYTGGIFSDKTRKAELEHEVSIVGFGVDKDGTKYWIARNSWGSYWGERGFFRILRGENNMGIESYCSWAVPTDTWTKDVRNNTKNKLNVYEGFLRFVGNRGGCKRQSTADAK